MRADWSGTLCLDESQDTGGKGNHGYDGLTLTKTPLDYGWMLNKKQCKICEKWRMLEEEKTRNRERKNVK
jgi:hypothetical protein